MLWVSVFQLSSLSKWNFQNCTYNTYFGQFLLLSYCFKWKGLNPFLTNLKVFASTINDQWSINQTKLNKQMTVFLAKDFWVLSCLFIHWKLSRSLLIRQLWLRSKWSCLTNKFTNILLWNSCCKKCTKYNKYYCKNRRICNTKEHPGQFNILILKIIYIIL